MRHGDALQVPLQTLALLVFAFAIARTKALDLQIGVVESDPELGARLAAALDAGLRAEAVIDDDEIQQNVNLAPVEPNEPLALSTHICLQARDGAQAVASGDKGNEGVAAAVRAGVLLLLTAPSPHRNLDALATALDLFPHPDVLATAVAELCVAKGWREAVVLHEGSARAIPLLARRDHLTLRARQLPPLEDDDALRNLLLILKKWGANKFIVWCEAECSKRVLDAAQRVGLLSERHAYLLPALDLHTLSLDDFSHGGANITALQLFEPNSTNVVEAMRIWQEEYKKRLGDAANEEEVEQIAAAPATALVLAYDAARIIAAAQRELKLSAGERGECEHGSAAFHADTLLNYIRSRGWKGASSEAGLRWAAGGARRDVSLLAAELIPGGELRTAAAWSAHGGLAWRPRPPAPPPPTDSMTNRTFVVLIAENKPYIMRQQSADRLSGNERYEGFCIELIERLAQLLQFNYTLVEQPDGNYGSRNKTTGQWNGMMHRLMTDPGIDFAITDLTITAEREEAVDFTTPFMNLGIAIMFRRPQPPAPALLAFLLPFSNGVWLCVALAYLGTSLVLYAVGRLCPDEWQNPYPCVEEPPALENQFTLGNALWFNMGAVLMQGSEVAPVAYGTRAVASAWWVFALVIVNSYTANLATLLGTKTSNELIHDVRELADNELGITYGAKDGGSTYTFFEYSNNELYKRMYLKIKDQENPKTNEAGINKVVNENYAFFAESTTIEYTIERNCEVTMVGEQLDSKGYGIAMKKNSPYRHSLNLALLNLQESGVLREMKYRWWNEKHGGGACQPNDDPSNEELSMRNFLGLFLVLVVGCFLGIVVSCCDLAWTAWQHPRDPSISFSRSFWAELRFVFRLDLSEKPVRGPLTPPRDSPRLASASPGSDRSTSPHSASVQSVEGQERLRSLSNRRNSARRSSMHTASMRLARHTTPTPR
ncbi:glutamate receptor ionotropic, kainate 2 [Pieris rapae]|uniref:glutamate receptor ionotropic, kainate 2 n=1 Tax=Pieris rapae TaxID=64459 RepID=UPI001E280C6D|nr:glutamate receptor ionotropic, kainate 2 [Pieris rapae]